MVSNNSLKYLIAVSGGPDSMALLDMARRHCLNLLCVHVNYLKRESAYRDELIVAKYCQKYQIPFIKINATKHQGNFQGWARDFRYTFFKKVGMKYQTNRLLVAHQLDDYLETCIMQLQRGSIPFSFGIKSIINEYDLTIFRPLIKYTKKDLLNYCLNNNIEFGIDESNLENQYKRNQIRHEYIEKLSSHIKLSLYLKIEHINEIRNNKLISDKNNYKKNIYDLEEIKDYKSLLRTKLYYDLSENYLDEIYRQIITGKDFIYDVRDKTISKYQKKLYFDDRCQEYEFIINYNEKIDTPYFKILNSSDSFRCATISLSEYPIKIRNYQKGDVIEMKYGKKKISRFFIDYKIPLIYRKRWPIVENCYGDIILVPGIGSNINHYSIKPNFFMIELLNTEMEVKPCIKI